MEEQRARLEAMQMVLIERDGDGLIRVLADFTDYGYARTFCQFDTVAELTSWIDAAERAGGDATVPEYVGNGVWS